LEFKFLNSHHFRYFSGIENHHAQQYFYALLPIGFDETSENLKSFLFEQFLKDGERFVQFIHDHLVGYSSDGKLES
jgi:hypothetical protein